MAESFTTSVVTDAPASAVWTVLTDLELMRQWLGGDEMGIQVETDWHVGSPIYIRGFHHIKFENKGKILHCEKEKKLSYTQLSSISRLPDEPKSYSLLEFILEPSGSQTRLTLTITNFPTEVIRKHLEFYWRTTIIVIKRSAEAIAGNVAVK